MKIKDTLFKLYKKFLGFFPSATPQGLTAFNEWAQSIIDTYNPPMDERSVKFTLCALLMRTGPSQAYISKRWFALCLHRGAAAQVAAYEMENIKEEQKKEYAAQLEAAKQLEATQSTTEDTSNVIGHVQNQEVS